MKLGYWNSRFGGSRMKSYELTDGLKLEIYESLNMGESVSQAFWEAAQKRMLEYLDNYIGSYIQRLSEFDLTNSSPALLVAGVDELRKLWASLLRDLGIGGK